jgi:signal peptide peptidase SppA
MKKDYKDPLVTNIGTQYYKHVIGDLTKSSWAIIPNWLDQIHGIVGRKIHGIDASDDFKGDAGYSHEMSLTNGSAVVPIKGPLFKKANMMTEFSGATSMALVSNDFRAALADDSVKQIVLHIDSPGGTIDGTKELADLIYESRGGKPIIAYVDGMAASAAYWIASAADKIVASSETAIVGSVGVITAHYDYSKYYENEGVKKKYIYQGKYKGMGREAEPLTKEGEALIQGEIDGLYSIFVESVAKNLGISAEKALEITDGSKIFNGQEGVELGLVHEIATLDSVLSIEHAETQAEKGNWTHGTKTNKEEESMNLKELKIECPELVDAITAEARVGYVSVEESDAKYEVVKVELDQANVNIQSLEKEGKEKDKKVSLMEASQDKATAKTIKSEILADSDIPEKYHVKVEAMVSHEGFVKDDEAFTAESDSGKAFAAAFSAEVADWEKTLDLSDGGPGLTASKTDAAKTATAKEDSEYAKNLVRSSGAKVRSEAK